MRNTIKHCNGVLYKIRPCFWCNPTTTYNFNDFLRHNEKWPGGKKILVLYEYWDDGHEPCQFWTLPVLTCQFHLQNLVKHHWGKIIQSGCLISSSQCEHERDTRTFSRFPSNISAARLPGAPSGGAPSVEWWVLPGVENLWKQLKSAKRRTELFFWERKKQSTQHWTSRRPALLNKKTNKQKWWNFLFWLLILKTMLFYLSLCCCCLKKGLLQAHSFLLRACGSGNSLSFGFDFVTWCKKALLNLPGNESFGASTSSSFANNRRLKTFTQAPRAASPQRFAPARVRVMSLMLTSLHSQHVCQAPPPLLQTLCGAYRFL